MDTSIIFERTASGNEKFQAGARELSNEQRMALIMVDGKRSAQDIVKTLAAIGNGYGLLSQLVDLGVISPKPIASAKVMPMATRASSQNNADPQIRQYAVKTIGDALGAMGDKLCLKIERTKTSEELMPLIETARMILMEYVGEARASAFEAHVEYLRSGGESKVA
jgi:hypothetical protein